MVCAIPAVELIELELTLVPIAFMETTVTAYELPARSSRITQLNDEDAEELISQLLLTAPAVAVATYLSTVDPPFESLAAQLTSSALPSVGFAETELKTGALGLVSHDEVCAAEAAPSPAALDAVTAKLYVVPFARVVNWHEVPLAEQVIALPSPTGVAVTV